MRCPWGWRGWGWSRWGRCWGGRTNEAVEDGCGRLGLDVADCDGFGEPAGTIEEMRDLVVADLPLAVDELGEVAAVDVDAALGEGEVLVHAKQGAEHAGWLVLGVGFEFGQRRAVQVLDPGGYLDGCQVGQAPALRGGGPGRLRHVGASERRGMPAGSRLP